MGWEIRAMGWAIPCGLMQLLIGLDGRFATDVQSSGGLVAPPRPAR